MTVTGAIGAVCMLPLRAIISASVALGIHPNTFRYRLRRLIDLFGLNLSEPDERLVLDLQLRLVQAVGGGSSAAPGVGDMPE